MNDCSIPVDFRCRPSLTCGPNLKRTIGTIAGVLLAIVIRLQPAIGQLDATGRSALAVIALGVVFWATDVLNAGITALLVLGLLIISGVPSPVALGGYGGGAFWILVCVLFFGTAMQKTGLARRISYRILLIFRPTYGGILTAFLLIGFVLTLGIPSMTVRTAIVVPIAFALVQAVGLPLPSRGAALIVLGAFEMAVLPGCAILTGSLWGPFITGLFANANIPITWFEYARVMTVPTIVWCVLLTVANYLTLRPPQTTAMNKDSVRTEMAALGPMKGPEMVTALIVALSIAAWASQPWHRVPPEAVGMVALAGLFATGVLAPPEIGTGIPWPLALFVGGMLSVSTVMTTYKINAWLGGFILPALRPFVANRFVFVVAMSVAVAVMRLVDPVGFIAIAAFFLPLVAFMSGVGIQPLVLTGIILLPVHVFWFNYQNIWIVMTEGISKKSAYTDADRVKMGTTFFGVTIVALWLAIGYWRLAGLM